MLGGMSTNRMRTLGRKGGKARALALGSGERSAIARAGAAARWTPTPLVLEMPQTHEELVGFVAQYKNGYCTSAVTRCDHVVAILHRAVAAARDDAGLARMLPLFVWRVRTMLHAEHIAVGLSPRAACALGYFVELAFRLGGEAAWTEHARGLTNALRDRAASVTRPFVFSRKMDDPMLRAYTAERTPATARAWRLIYAETDESFERYFRKFVPNPEAIAPGGPT